MESNARLGSARFGFIVLAGAVLAGCQEGPAPIPFTAKLTCPVPGKNPKERSDAVLWPVGPAPNPPCDQSTLGEACRLLVMTQEHCSWEGLELAGQALTQSVMHGQGYWEGDGGVVTNGYDWGTVANGDSYLSRWTETIAGGKISGTWTLVLGTGKLNGITGEATIACVPPGEGAVENCTVTGSYSIPD